MKSVYSVTRTKEESLEDRNIAISYVPEINHVKYKEVNGWFVIYFDEVEKIETKITKARKALKKHKLRQKYDLANHLVEEKMIGKAIAQEAYTEAMTAYQIALETCDEAKRNLDDYIKNQEYMDKKEKEDDQIRNENRSDQNLDPFAKVIELDDEEEDL